MNQLVVSINNLMKYKKQFFSEMQHASHFIDNRRGIECACALSSDLLGQLDTESAL